ncbi:MAG: arylsulfatase [Verrucomicrobiota bacterium]
MNKLILTCLLAAVAWGEKPNIIYIMCDDAGFGDFSCYGQKLFETPNIDKLATEGMKFSQHYSGSTVCAPSRCSLMTGYHTGHCFVRGNKEVRPVGQHPIPDATLTVAEILKKAGYTTGAFGKWGLGSPGSEGDPVHQGFDRFYGYNCQRNAHTYYPRWLFDNLKRVELDGKTYSHDLIMEQGLNWIRANKDKPFFCYLPVTIPHAAMHVPEKYVAPFRKKFSDYENTIGKYSGPQVKNPVAAFAGMMVKLDEDVGRLMSLLKDLGIDENTLVLFTSDNGPHKEGGHKPEVFDSNGPLSGLKRSLTEGGIRVPLIARWPGRIKPGSTSDHISAFWDFLPTACAVAGVQAPGGIDGISFLPALTGQGTQGQHAYLYWEFYEQGGKRAVRMGKWKAIQRNLHKSGHSPVLLYNLEKDLGETRDLAKDHPEVLDRMRKIFDEASTPSEIWRFKGLQKSGA